MFGLRARRRKKLLRTPLREAWRGWVDRNVPYARALPPEDRRELEGKLQVLLAEKRFEGCGGLELTDEIRVTIAAQAAVLLLHRETDYYPALRTILVYPHAYRAAVRRSLPDGTVVAEGQQARLGESWYRGPLVLSWSDVVRGAAAPADGRNVVFHEFAHQLDAESGAVEGAPVLASRAMYREWARVLGSEYERLAETLHRDHDALIDDYGATSPAEFFAVVTEVFFERPMRLRREHPALYAELASFYRQDPAALAQQRRRRNGEDEASSRNRAGER